MTTIEQAKAILGDKNVFGPDEWMAFFGKKAEFDGIPDIPWSENALQSPEISQPHFLFLGLNKLANKPLNLCTWYELCPGPQHPKLFESPYSEQMDNDHPYSHPLRPGSFDYLPCEFRWFFMPVGIVKGSRNIRYRDKDKILQGEYQVPSLIERVTANILYHFLNKKYLDSTCEACTNDEVSNRRSGVCYRVTVLGKHVEGLMICARYDLGNESVGVAASKNRLSKMDLERMRIEEAQRQKEIEREKMELEQEAQNTYLFRNKE